MDTPFQFIAQQSANDCGYACLRMVCAHFGITADLDTHMPLSEIGGAGLNLQQMKEAAARLGLHAMAHWWEWKELAELQPLPCVALMRGSHFVVVHGITGSEVLLADPASGFRSHGHAEFCNQWHADGRSEGLALNFSRMF